MRPCATIFTFWQIVAGETTQNIVETPPVQEKVIVQEIPQVSIVERIQEQIVTSAPHAVGSFTPSEKCDSHMYNQIQQEQIVAGEMTQYRVGNPAVQEHVIVREQVVGSLPPLEKFHVPVYNQIHQEQVVAGMATQHRVENPSVQEQVIIQKLPQVVGWLPPLEEFDAPVYNHIHQEQIVAGETTQNIVEKPAVREQVIVQEIPQVSIVERTQEQIVSSAPHAVGSFPPSEKCDSHMYNQSSRNRSLLVRWPSTELKIKLCVSHTMLHEEYALPHTFFVCFGWPWSYWVHDEILTERGTLSLSPQSGSLFESSLRHFAKCVWLRHRAQIDHVKEKLCYIA